MTINRKREMLMALVSDSMISSVTTGSSASLVCRLRCIGSFALPVYEGEG